MKKPVDAATAHTVSFVVQHVQQGATIVEVGCGEGHVALGLQQRGYHVQGIDSDAQAVERAQRAGATVSQASWPDYDPGRVDAVLFTRSLHHIHLLHEAIVRANEVLHPGGVLLLEDFAFDQADERTIQWFIGVLQSDAVKTLIHTGRDEFVNRLLGAELRVEAWHEDHDHNLHSIEAMRGAVAEHFSIEREAAVPYLYRYLVPVLPETPHALARLQGIHRMEASAIAAGAIVPIGRRVVGVLRSCR